LPQTFPEAQLAVGARFVGCKLSIFAAAKLKESRTNIHFRATDLCLCDFGVKDILASFACLDFVY